MLATAAQLEDSETPDGIVPPSLSGLLGFQLRMAQAAVYRDFAAAMGELGLTQRQIAVLEIVGAAPGVSQVDIAAELSTDRATMMAIVDRLQDRKLVVRQRSNEDRRRQELHLTPGGADILHRTREVIAQHEKRLTDRFSPDELAALFDALRRLQS